MQKTCINKQTTNTKCIIFFNGWGMDSNAIQHLSCEDFDIFEFYDYSNITFDSKQFEKYEELYLIAWSMGVWAASQVFRNCNLEITKKIAINGTELPMHNDLGIANAVFEGTLQNWSEAIRTKFNARMCGTRTQLQNDTNKMSQRTIENQQKELQSIYNQIVGITNAEPYTWNIAILGEQDFIFTYENQKNYWLEKVKCITLPIPHYPFSGYKSWSEIISMGE